MNHRDVWETNKQQFLSTTAATHHIFPKHCNQSPITVAVCPSTRTRKSPKMNGKPRVSPRKLAVKTTKQSSIRLRAPRRRSLWPHGSPRATGKGESTADGARRPRKRCDWRPRGVQQQQPTRQYQMTCIRLAAAGTAWWVVRDRTIGSLCSLTQSLLFAASPRVALRGGSSSFASRIGAKDYQDPPYYKFDQGAFYFDQLRPEVQQEIWTDPSWTRAVLIREPTERLLSAYLDKIAAHRAGYGKVNFSDFVDLLNLPDPPTQQSLGNGTQMSGVTWYTDPHWRPQAFSCGLAQLLPQFQHVGGLDRVAEHSKAILQMVGLWETHGKHYRLSQEQNEKEESQNSAPRTAGTRSSGTGVSTGIDGIGSSQSRGTGQDRSVLHSRTAGTGQAIVLDGLCALGCSPEGGSAGQSARKRHCFHTEPRLQYLCSV